MHRHRLVEAVGAQDVVVRRDQLGPDQQRLHPARGEERQRGEQVEQADALVVDGGEPAGQAPALAPDALQALDAGQGLGCGDDGHYRSDSR